MYLSSIIWLFTWPLLIYVSYKAVRYALRKLESKLEE
ncbi:hypothetical protein BXY64_0624 [Marinifilum flexuosum]|uniref:Uncharacterized protein n=1 Tax=Marinifilum flexuosum TaxID=1117708 RepID=A0A419X7A5_9BACT|nr:hypothetical protein BXY64_0624 [Marinifilum flexuosum]